MNWLIPTRPLNYRPPRHPEPLKLIIGAKPVYRAHYTGTGFIAGTATGIVTVDGRPAARRILCIRRDNFRVVRDTWSKPDGTYLLPGLNPQMDFIVLALDHEGRWEPVAWDWVRPATELPSPAAPGP